MLTAAVDIYIGFPLLYKVTLLHIEVRGVLPLILSEAGSSTLNWMAFLYLSGGNMIITGAAWPINFKMSGNVLGIVERWKMELQARSEAGVWLRDWFIAVVCCL